VPAEIGLVIGSVAGGLSKLGDRQEPAPEAAQPVVPVRRSISRDHLICLLCGKKQKVLKRHLATAHGLTPPEYRERFGLKPDYPMTAPGYAAQRSELARQFGLGRKPVPAAPAAKATASKSSPSRKQRLAGRSTRSKAASPRKRRATGQPEGVTKADQSTATT
ncbi:MAG: MucR family transcriptional regulator, partial [Geminicoccaceae bacterium]